MKFCFRFFALICSLTCAACISSPSNRQTPDTAAALPVGKQPDEAIVLTIDGKVRTIAAGDLEPDTIAWNNRPIKMLFRKKSTTRDKHEFEINLNVYSKNVLSEIPVTYTIPEANMPGVVVDLNFFDFERRVEKRMNKRLIFDKGTINIHELSEEKVRFDFKGEAHELMNSKRRSVVSGSVNVRY